MSATLELRAEEHARLAELRLPAVMSAVGTASAIRTTPTRTEEPVTA